jgi:hypothetical protein
MAKAKAKPKQATWYKVLNGGRSFHGGSLKWSLPVGDKPGEWHQVEGVLDRCRNGLHLTDDPPKLRPRTNPATCRCYAVEVDESAGMLPPYDGERVVRRCRLVREVPWEDFAPSPVLVLLRHVWKAQGAAHGRHSHSWRRLNDAMQRALALAIDSGMAFNQGDFAVIAREFNPEFWLHIEGCYVHACGKRSVMGTSHGANMTAIRAIEDHLGRRPFLVRETADPDAKRVRLHVGTVFDWHVDLEKRVRVKVTSFAADQSHVVACSYKTFYKSEEDDTGKELVDRVFRITHADLDAYHAAIRDHARTHAAPAATTREMTP